MEKSHKERLWHNRVTYYEKSVNSKEVCQKKIDANGET